MHVHSHGSRVAVLAIGLLALVAAPALSGPPKVFESPEAAARALVEAAGAEGNAALVAVFGDGAEEVVNPPEDPMVRQRRAKFVAAAQKQLVIEKGENDTRIVTVGPDRWPFPVPLVKAEGGWRFDLASGKEEILSRVIGENELEAIDIIRDYVAAQVAYASKDRDGDGVREFAQRLISSAGQKDGLYWDDDGDPSPLGADLPALEGVTASEKPQPFMGYYWRILTGQGARAPGGAYSYVINGNMVAGFAILATPAEHGKTGVMTLLASHHGKIYEKDLGPDPAAARAITVFDPDDTWDEVVPE